MNALTHSAEPGVVLIVDDTPDNLAYLRQLRWPIPKVKKP